MKLVTCPKCQSQFDVATMQPGSTFVCGKCRNVLQVPAAPPVMTPIGQAPAAPAPVQTVQAHQVRHAQSAPPPTVALTPEEMKKALASVKQASPGGRPKLPAAMEKRRQSANPARAAGAPVVPQAAPAAPRQGPAPPNTVVLTPDEMRKALAASKTGVAPTDDAEPAPAPAAAKPASAKSAARSPARGAPRRAGAAAAPAAAAVVEAEAGDEDVPMAAPMKKSPVALYAGIGAVALVGVIAFAMMGGKDEKKDEPKKPDVAEAPKVPLDEKQEFAAMTPGNADLFIARKFSEAGNDPVKLERVYTWMKDPVIADNPKAKAAAAAAAEAALRADPSAAWVRSARSEKPILELLTKTKAAAPCAFSQPTADEAAIDAALAKYKNEPWVSEKVYDELDKVCKTVLVREQGLANNPRLPTALRKHEWAEKSPMFTGLKWLPAKFDDPYLISQQYEEFKDDSEKHKNEDRRKKAQWVADTDAIVFQKTYAHWLELFGERFKLPKLESTNRVLHAIITWNRGSFADLYRRNNPGAEVSDGIRAFYSPHEQRIFHYLGDEAMRSQDEIPCEDDRIQKFAYQVAAHEETHQLQHEYTAIYQGHPLVDNAMDVMPRRQMWFEEGLAEFMGCVEVDRAAKDDLAKATFYHNRLQLSRLVGVRGTGRGTDQRADARLWTFDSILRPNHHGELQKIAEELNPGHQGEMVSHFYGRAWGLTHFLWFYDNGKYREKFMAYLELCLKDQQSASGFAKIMGKKGSDWGDIALEFEWYWNQCLRRKIPTDDEPKSRALHCDTDAPEGKWVKEDDDE